MVGDGAEGRLCSACFLLVKSSCVLRLFMGWRGAERPGELEGVLTVPASLIGLKPRAGLVRRRLSCIEEEEDVLVTSRALGLRCALVGKKRVDWAEDVAGTGAEAFVVDFGG